MNTIFITPPTTLPFRAEIDIPGSKSYTLRAMLLGAMTSGTVRLLFPLLSDDTRAMLTCLGTLGIESQVDPDGAIEILGDITAVQEKHHVLHANLSAATLRFLLALSCLLPGAQTIQGFPALNRRPVATLVEALRHLGAEIEYLEQPGFPPVRVNSSVLRGNEVSLSGEISSQYISALMLIAPLLTKGLRINIEGASISRPYLAMTADMMKQFGVSVRQEQQDNTHRYTILPGGYRAESCRIEGDVSSAAYFLAIAALSRSEITIRNFNPDSLQADMRFLSILELMGATIQRHPPEVSAITLTGCGIQSIQADLRDFPDQAQTLAVLAAFADGVTSITGIGSLRIKETDRIAALQTELSTMGIRTEATPDSLTIYGGNPKPALINTYGDHRMAMAFAVAGALLPGLGIAEPEVVHKTFPGFWDTMSALGFQIQPDPACEEAATRS